MRRFWCNGFVFARIAGRCSSFARTATAGTGIAVPRAAVRHGVSSAGAPIGGINAARKGGSITATGSASIGLVDVLRARA
jgi:hypothetical protein